MAYQYSPFQVTARVQHWHDGDQWEDMEEVTAHDVAEDDPERKWRDGRIFRCTACDEQFRVAAPDAAPSSELP